MWLSGALCLSGFVALWLLRRTPLGGGAHGGAPMKANTLFRVRSTGKSITGVAMMQLWEQGKWKPEDPITKFLPELANLKVATSNDNLDNLAPATRTPTMHELMTHTAGFSYGLRIEIAADRAYLGTDVRMVALAIGAGSLTIILLARLRPRLPVGRPRLDPIPRSPAISGPVRPDVQRR